VEVSYILVPTTMPFPLISLLAGVAIGKTASKEEKKIAVNGRVKKDGTKSKAHLRKKAKKKY
jgi:hypothetical protein